MMRKFLNLEYRSSGGCSSRLMGNRVMGGTATSCRAPSLRKTMMLTRAPPMDLIIAEALRWHRPCKTLPLSSTSSSPTWRRPSLKAMPLGLRPQMKTAMMVRSLCPAKLRPRFTVDNAPPPGDVRSKSTRTISPFRSPHLLWIFSLNKKKNNKQTINE